MLIISLLLQNFVDTEGAILKVIFNQIEVRRDGYTFDEYKTELYNFMNEQLRTLQVLYFVVKPFWEKAERERESNIFSVTYSLSSVSVTMH